jgi:hypothetical protein
MDEHTNTENRITRRGSLVKLGGLAATAIGAGIWKASDQASAQGTGPAGVASGAVSCVLAPEQTEGPYYLPDDKVRRNVTEGKPGVPLTLQLAVVDVSTCKPIKGAAVDIWHCDAAKGVATFRTIWPGWYPGRTVHIHVRVYLGGNILHTGQLYFPDSLTDAVYQRSPYNSRPNRETRNTVDSIYRNGGNRSLLRLKKSGRGYVGTITMGVQRA